MRLALATALIGGSLLAAMPAAAATPFTAGTGSGPDLAVTPNGMAHIVLLTDETGDKVRYCRVPAGGSACDSESTSFPFPTDTTSTAARVNRPLIFATGGANLTIVAACTQCPSGDIFTKAFRWTSTDNGANFTPSATPIGDLGPNGQGGRLGSLELVLEGSQFQAMPDAGTAPVDLGGGVFSPAVVGDPGGQKAVYATTNSGVVSYRIFQDPSPTAAELNDVTTPTDWGPLQTLSSPEGNNLETHLSSGSRGTILSYVSGTPGIAGGVRMRTLDGTNTFGGPTNVQGSDPIDNSSDQPHHSQEGGRIHFAWRTLYDGNRLRYTCSPAGGQPFSTPATLATRESFHDPVVQGGGTCDKGFAAWRNQNGDIRAVAIEPVPESTPPAGGPGGGGPGGGTGPGGSGTTPAISDFAIGSSTLAPGQGTSFTFTSDRAGTAVLTVEKRLKGLKVKKAGATRCVGRTRKRVRRVRRQLGRRADVRRLSGRARRRRIARLLRKRRCTLYRKVGEIRQEVVGGRNTIVFTGSLAGRPLSPGTYRATLVVTDTAGNVSRTETVTFRVRRR